MVDSQFYVLFNSIPVISGQWMGDNERLCATEPYLQLKRFSPQTELNLTYDSPTNKIPHAECPTVSL